MKSKILLLLLLISIYADILNAQFKGPDEKYKNSSFLGLFNSKNFTMQHSFEVGFMNSAYGNISLTSYINRMNYKISDNMNISADIKLQYSPYVSSRYGKEFAGQMQSDLTGLYLSRVAFDYKISDNAFFKFEFRNLDGSSMYNNYYNPFSGYNDSRFANWP
jgi:hypothetical protein